MIKTFSITTTLPYINAAPHIGFAFEIVGADVLARYHTALEEKVIFNAGTDEHGQKVYEKALELGIEPQKYCDKLVSSFQELKETLNLSYTNFIRTTDEHHLVAAQEMWKRCKAAGDIYKKKYEVKYCIGCELEKTDSELDDDGCCPLHPGKKLEMRAEENYFFRFSKYAQQLLELYDERKLENNPFVLPESKQKEIYAFVKGQVKNESQEIFGGLKDFSISRLKSKMPWGIDVPDDEEQVMYVWFDALTNYISTLGWPEIELNSENGWPAVQVAGKDNLRQQSAMWQAMLMSAGIKPSAKILINGFIMVDGQKMSKSLGNVISPQAMVEKFGTEVTRFLMAGWGNFGTDVDVSWEKMIETYHAELTNGLGNLCSRVAKMGENLNLSGGEKVNTTFNESFADSLNKYEVGSGLQWIKNEISLTDKYLSEEQPWMIKDNDDKKIEIINEAINKIIRISHHLMIYMPETATVIEEHFTAKEIIALKPLFPRINI